MLICIFPLHPRVSLRCEEGVQGGAPPFWLWQDFCHIMGAGAWGVRGFGVLTLPIWGDFGKTLPVCHNDRERQTQDHVLVSPRGWGCSRDSRHPLTSLSPQGLMQTYPATSRGWQGPGTLCLSQAT